tara:strand:+ start:22547 stop:22675 length:129 start_codon:yes stop_codon:yes gene_type:complete
MLRGSEYIRVVKAKSADDAARIVEREDKYIIVTSVIKIDLNL